MSPEEIKSLVREEVKKEKQRLSKLVNDKLLYTGEFAIEKWASE
jgi:hypothetical protein